MRQLIFIAFAATLLSFQCNPSNPSEKPGKPVKDAEAELKKSKLQTVTLLDSAIAKARIKRAVDTTLKRDYSLGMISAKDLKIISSVPGLKSMYLVRGNYLPKDQYPNMATTMVVLMYEVASTDSGDGTNTVVREQTVYGEVKVCPPPDGNFCLQKLGIKGFDQP